MGESKMANYVISTTVKKAFTMLECIGQYQPILPTQIQQHLQFDKSSVHRLLATLEHLGYIKRIEPGYILTYKMYALGNTVPSSREIIQLAKPHMENLSKKVKHNISLCVENQNNIIRIFLVEFPGDLRVAKEQDLIFPLNCSATGKLYLAHLKDIKKALPHLFEAAKKISAEMGAEFESRLSQ